MFTEAFGQMSVVCFERTTVEGRCVQLAFWCLCSVSFEDPTWMRRMQFGRTVVDEVSSCLKVFPQEQHAGVCVCTCALVVQSSGGGLHFVIVAQYFG